MIILREKQFINWAAAMNHPDASPEMRLKAAKNLGMDLHPAVVAPKTTVVTTPNPTVSTAPKVGIMGGLKNTWNRAGTLGKAGMVTAGVASTYLIGKGLFGGKKKDKN